jgi:hypothetical protein
VEHDGLDEDVRRRIEGVRDYVNRKEARKEQQMKKNMIRTLQEKLQKQAHAMDPRTNRNATSLYEHGVFKK